MNNQDAPLSEKDIAELEVIMADAGNAVPNQDAVSKIINKIPGFGKDVGNFFSGLFNSSHGQALFKMSKDVARETLYQKVGSHMQRHFWKVIQAKTGDLAKKYTVIHFLFHTAPGRAACTGVLCTTVALLALKVADDAELRGKTREANILRGLSKALVYSAGAGIYDALQIPTLLETISTYVNNVAGEVGVNLEDLGQESAPNTAA